MFTSTMQGGFFTAHGNGNGARAMAITKLSWGYTSACHVHHLEDNRRHGAVWTWCAEGSQRGILGTLCSFSLSAIILVIPTRLSWDGWESVLVFFLSLSIVVGGRVP